MPDNEQSGFLNEEDVELDEAPSIEELQEQNRKLQETLETSQQNEAKLNNTLKQIASDPDVLRVLQMKDRGEPVNIGQSQGQQPTITDPGEKVYMQIQSGEVSIDDLTPSQLAAYMQHSTDKRVEGTLQKVLGPIAEKFKTYDNERLQQQQSSMSQEMMQVRSKYRDFDQLRPQMVKVAQQNPGLGIEDIYILTKGRLGSPITPASALDTERPDERPVSISPRPSGKKEQKQVYTRDWSAMLSDAVDRMNIPNLE